MKSNQSRLLLILPILLLVIATLFMMTENKKVDENEDTSTQTPTPLVALINYDDAFIYGNTEASNELVVFTNYHCEYCQDFYLETFPQLEREYVAKDQLKIIFLENTVSIDKLGILMSKVTEIGRTIGKYRSIQNKFYTDDNNQYVDSVSVVKVLLEEGIRQEEIITLLQRQDIVNRVEQQLAEGERLDVHGTPMFYLNGQLLEGYTGQNNFMQYFHQYYIEN